jgi:hypothetical protein
MIHDDIYLSRQTGCCAARAKPTKFAYRSAALAAIVISTALCDVSDLSVFIESET